MFLMAASNRDGYDSRGGLADASSDLRLEPQAQFGSAIDQIAIDFPAFAPRTRLVRVPVSKAEQRARLY